MSDDLISDQGLGKNVKFTYCKPNIARLLCSHDVNRESDMHIISRDPFEDAARKYPNDAASLIAAYRLLKENEFESPAELRKLFPNLDNFKYRNKWWVINIGGNNLRMISYINFINQRFYVKHIVTHAEYDKLTRQYREIKE